MQFLFQMVFKLNRVEFFVFHSVSMLGVLFLPGVAKSADFPRTMDCPVELWPGFVVLCKLIGDH